MNISDVCVCAKANDNLCFVSINPNKVEKEYIQNILLNQTLDRILMCVCTTITEVNGVFVQDERGINKLSKTVNEIIVIVASYIFNLIYVYYTNTINGIFAYLLHILFSIYFKKLIYWSF